MSERRRIRVSFIGDVATVKFNDKTIVDNARIEELSEELSSIIDSDHRRYILLDFGSVEFMSSAALNILILFNRQIKQVGGKLQLCNVRAEILEVFSITRLDRLFDIRRTGDQDEGPDMTGTKVPRPTPPDNLDGHAAPPQG